MIYALKKVVINLVFPASSLFHLAQPLSLSKRTIRYPLQYGTRYGTLCVLMIYKLVLRMVRISLFKSEFAGSCTFLHLPG